MMASQKNREIYFRIITGSLIHSGLPCRSPANQRRCYFTTEEAKFTNVGIAKKTAPL
jgi:hypothetical protein